MGIFRKITPPAVLLAALVCCFSFLRAADSDCGIIFFFGEVDVRTGGRAAWEPAFIGQVLKAGDAIRTKPESRAEIGLADGSVIKVTESALFEVKDADPDEQRHAFKVLSGKIIANVKTLTRSRSEFTVESPVAIAAIRGTRFSMEFGNNKAVIAVFEGVVDVKTVKGKKTVRVEQNKQVTVTETGHELTDLDKSQGAVDEKGPALQVRTDLLDRWTNRSTINISGQITRSGGTEGLTLTINGDEVAFSGNSFDHTCYLEDGPNAIPVSAVDKNGNSVTAVVDAFYDRLRPNVIITRPAAGAKEINFQAPPGMEMEKTYTVTGFIMDPEPSSGIESVIINGREVALARDYSFSFDIDGIIGGQTFAVDLEIVARDRAGNETVDTSRRIEFEWK